jgi:ribosomal protein S12 methylthiotransferase
MARPRNPEKVMDLIREVLPEAKIRSTFIVGFPGETDEQFEHLVQFIEKYRFDRLGVFTYSKQMEVPSGHMENQLTEKVKKARRNRIMRLQHDIAFDSNKAMVGQVIPVLIESHDESKKLYTGRSQWDAPGIDNQVYVRESADAPVYMAEVNMVLVEEAKPYDLIGVAYSGTESVVKPALVDHENALVTPVSISR